MLNCFDNLIGLIGVCSPATSDSGLNLDQLGINASEVEQYIGDEYPNALSLFNTMRKNAVSQITHKINTAYSKKYIMHSIVENTKVSDVVDDMTVVSGSANKYRGIELEVFINESPLNLFISELALFTDYTGNVNVLVYDTQQNKLLDTITVACTANQITTKFVNKSYRIDRRKMNIVFIYDTTSVNSYQTQIRGYNTVGCGSCNNSVGKFYRTSVYANARGVEFTSAEQKIPSNATGINDTAGMIITYNLSCDHESWMCGVANVLAYPILLRTGINILQYGRLVSMRTNDRTLINPEKLQERIDLLELVFNDSIQDVMLNMTLPNDPLCFHCTKNTVYRTTLP